MREIIINSGVGWGLAITPVALKPVNSASAGAELAILKQMVAHFSSEICISA